MTMQPVTHDQLRDFTDNDGREDYIDALVQLWPEVEAAGITTELRWCHFIAQAAHETGGLTIVRENTRWTPEQIKSFTGKRFATLSPKVILAKGDPEALANVVYGGRNGNGPDEGYIYRGGGPFQTTWADNYQEVGKAIGVDLLGSPSLIEDPVIGWRAALHEWGKMDGNRLADHNYGRAIGNALNRGYAYSAHEPVGFKGRCQWFQKAWAQFGGGQSLPGPDAPLYLGAHGQKVKRIQGQLRDLGYGVGDQDGVYGPAMARGVAAFKLDQTMQAHARGVDTPLAAEPNDMIGPETEAALDHAEPVRLSPERENTTIAELQAKGSTEVAAGRHAEVTGTALTAAGGLALAEKAGVLEAATAVLGKVSLFHKTAVPALQAVAWGIQNLWWVGLIVGGIYMWRSGKAVQLARLAAHQLGFNLSR
jgi:putative chitinase